MASIDYRIGVFTTQREGHDQVTTRLFRPTSAPYRRRPRTQFARARLPTPDRPNQSSRRPPPILFQFRLIYCPWPGFLTPLQDMNSLDELLLSPLALVCAAAVQRGSPVSWHHMCMQMPIPWQIAIPTGPPRVLSGLCRVMAGIGNCRPDAGAIPTVPPSVG